MGKKTVPNATPEVAVKLARSENYFTATLLGAGSKIADVESLQKTIVAQPWVYAVTRRGTNIVIDYKRASVGMLESFLREVLATFGFGLKPIAR